MSATIEESPPRCRLCGATEDLIWVEGRVFFLRGYMCRDLAACYSRRRAEGEREGKR